MSGRINCAAAYLNKALQRTAGPALQLAGSGELVRDCYSRQGVSGGGR